MSMLCLQVRTLARSWLLCCGYPTGWGSKQGSRSRSPTSNLHPADLLSARLSAPRGAWRTLDGLGRVLSLIPSLTSSGLLPTFEHQTGAVCGQSEQGLLAAHFGPPKSCLTVPPPRISGRVWLGLVLLSLQPTEPPRSGSWRCSKDHSGCRELNLVGRMQGERPPHCALAPPPS